MTVRLTEDFKIADLNRELSRNDDFNRRLIELEKQVDRIRTTFSPVVTVLSSQGPGGGWNSTSTTFVNWSAFSPLNFTKKYDGTNLLVLASFSLFISTAGDSLSARTVIDTSEGATVNFFKNEIASHHPMILSQIHKNIPKGTRSAWVQVKKVNGANQMNTDSNDFIQLTIIEYIP